MEAISAGEIIEWSGGRLVSGDVNKLIDSVCIDGRKIARNGLFVPFKGERVDAHDFIGEVFSKGAGICLIDKFHSFNGTDGTVIQVDDVKKALQDIASNYGRKFNIPVIGVTGSVGKSTTKEMISCALSSSLKVLKTEGNHNGQIGLPLTLLNLDSGYNVVVVEMGISEFGEMEILRRIADPDIGVITNIGVSHLENLKTVENIREEKLKIIKEDRGRYYLNGDNPLLFNINPKRLRNFTYFGLNGSYPYRAEDVCLGSESTDFVLITEKFRENITIPCLGMHNVYNALAAVAVALDMGVHLDDIKNGLASYKGLDMRQQISKLAGVTVIDDSYNSSPDSVKSSISLLRAIKSPGKNIAVISDMLELGERSDDMHFDAGKYMAIEGVDVLITVGEKAEILSEGARLSGKPIEVVHCGSKREAAEQAILRISEGDKILVKGSRGTHVEEIVESLKEALKNREIG